jgi:methyl-accepting chemotaxis protein
MLRTVVETAVSILKLYQTTLDAGEMTLEDAKKQAYATLTRKTHGCRRTSSQRSARALEDLARGDLTVRCGDLGQALRGNFNDALSHLEAAMAKVNAKGGDIGTSKEEIRRASNELSQRTERQAASLEETSAALELTVAVRQTAKGAHEGAKRCMPSAPKRAAAMPSSPKSSRR